MRNPGVSFTEYGLVLSLVAVLAIAGLAAVGGNLDQLLRGSAGSILDSVEPATQTAGTDGINGNEKGGSGENSGNNNGGNGGPVRNTEDGNGTATAIDTGSTREAFFGETERLCLRSGPCLTIPVVRGDAPTLTAGAMGGEMTHDMALVLDQIADALAAEGKTEPRVIDYIRDMANRGHTISDGQKSLADSCVPGQFCDYPEGINSISGPNGELFYINKQFNDFLTENPGALSPALQNIVNFEVRQIKAITDGYTATYSIIEPQAPAKFKFTFGVDDYKLVRQDANTICRTGGDSSCVR